MRRLSLLAALLLSAPSLCPASARADEPADPQVTLQQAMDLGQIGQRDEDMDMLQQAAQAYQQALSAGADPVTVWMGLGYVHAAQAHISPALTWRSEARHAFEQALDAGADPATVWMELGYLASAEVQIAQADACYRRALRAAELRPDDPDAQAIARAARAEILAMGLRQHATTVEPQDDETWQVEAGYGALAVEDRESALQHFANAAAFATTGAPPSTGKEWIQRHTPAQWLEQARASADDPAQAREALDAALLLGADTQLVLMELAYLDLRAGAADAAADGFRMVVELAERASDPVVRPLAWDRADRAAAELRAAGQGLGGGAALLDQLQARSAATWLSMAEQQAARGDTDAALASLDAARGWGADPELTALEAGYSAQAADRLDDALAYYRRAAAAAIERGTSIRSVPATRARALAAESLAPTRGAAWRSQGVPTVRQVVADAWEREANGDAEGALVLLDKALVDAVGTDRALVELERARMLKVRGDDPGAARASGQALELTREQARQDRVPEEGGPWTGEFYGHALGWSRLSPDKTTNMAPYLRARAYLHPFGDLDLNPYAFAELSGDLRSTGQGPGGYPLIYSDNSARLGVGALYRFWERQAGLFAQVGPAFNLLKDGTGAVELDLRAGAYVNAESAACRPASREPAPGFSERCLEGYAEAVYFTRFNKNLIAQGRGRMGFTAKVTGQWAWQPLVEARVLKDTRSEYWNNAADVGLAHRWRKLEGVPLDVMVGIHTGTYFGLHAADPAPARLGYTELRLLVSTGASF